MEKLIIWILWCVFGFCLSLGGCHARITAEKLEASIAIQQEAPVPPATIEVHYDEGDSRARESPEH